MRCLGIDHGTKRIGLSYGDELGVATPLPALIEADPAKRRAIVEFVRSLMTAIDRMKANPKEYFPFIAPKVGTTADLLEKSWPELHYNQNIAPDLLNVMVELL